MKEGIKKISLLAILFGAISCSGGNKQESETDVEGVTSVTLTHVSSGYVNDQVTFSATTNYQKEISISAPISGFVTKVFVGEGDRVEEDQSLFTVESKEHQALGKDASLDVGLVTVKSTFDGVVTKVNQQEGGYVSEGMQVCNIADRNSFVFLLNVPYIYTSWVKMGEKCTLVMPNDTQIVATIGQTLTTMNTASQTQAVVAKAKTGFLPEGLIVKVLLDKNPTKKLTQVLPTEAVQSDESLTKYWVMKLVNDSLAVKVPITIGNSSRDSVEIVSPELSPNDRIVLTGAYQMPDSAAVSIEHDRQ